MTRKFKSKLDQPVAYLKGVGPQKADLLKTELGIHTLGDLVYHFPFRYVDKTRFHKVAELRSQNLESVQIKGILRRVDIVGSGRKKRAVAVLRDGTGMIELVWFKGIQWIQKQLVIGKEYIAYGKPQLFGNKYSIAHPDLEASSEVDPAKALSFDPVYPSTEKLAKKGLDSRGIRRLVVSIMPLLEADFFPEHIPAYLCQRLKLWSHYVALRHIHFPKNKEQLEMAKRRLKFEELFLLQIRLLQTKHKRKQTIKGYQIVEIGESFNTFYHQHLPFELTDAQKKVIREIRFDLGSGKQMNRLLQGDVGSGKTIVGLLTMLMVIGNGYQATLLAPTEILALQHFESISGYLKEMPLKIGFLSGNVKGKKRKEILAEIANGEIKILIGTHAILEDPVIFQNLGLAITDEQHRFGVKQRAKLWKKNSPLPPHILVMTATPIPRTLAMTVYGDLDVSVIDQLPPGRKPVKTIQMNDSQRLRLWDFMKKQIQQGRQIYVVFPLIQESEKLDLKNLEEGYEHMQNMFPPPKYQLSIVHGKMKPADKEFEMQRFAKGETNIMVATTVIEVGVNVPNATVMIIENTERFGLSQLHQLRGRVGRGGEQSFCILMTSDKISKEGRKRVEIMVETNDGFRIAEEDMRLRGPGNIEGTQQSGIMNFKLVDLIHDNEMLKAARKIAQDILDEDPELKKSENTPLITYIQHHMQAWQAWARIS